MGFGGKSLGGYPADAVPAQQVGGASRTVASARGDVSPVAGGPEWVGEAPTCAGTMKKNGWPCDQSPRSGSPYCWGHRHLGE